MSYHPTVEFILDPSDGEAFIPKAPLHGTACSAGFDLYAASETHIPAGASVLVSTGVRMAIPMRWCGIISPRSSVASKTPLRIGARIIDSDYRGEIMVNLHNDSKTPWLVNQHERIAQIVFVQHLTKMKEVKSLPDTARGSGGFGSTGI